jgi:hypothetical protein
LSFGGVGRLAVKESVSEGREDDPKTFGEECYLEYEEKAAHGLCLV